MSKRRWLRIVPFVLVVLAASSARAQYQGIPNYTGPGAGLNFRTAINQRFAGVMPIAPLIVSLPFATLPPEQDGAILFCNDCKLTTPCAGGGHGAFAQGTRGAWSCSMSLLEGNLAVNGNLLNGVGGLTVNNDAIAEHDIAQFSINGAVNVRDPKYGASASMASGTATLNGTTAVTMDAVHDFAVGQHVAIYGAGPASSLGAPTLSVVGEAYGWQSSGILSVTNKYAIGNSGNSGCWIDKLSSLPPWQPSTNYSPGSEIAMNLNGQWYGFLAWNITSPQTSGSLAPDFKSLIYGPPSYLGGPWLTSGSTYVSDANGIHWTAFGILGNSSLANTACSTTYGYTVTPIDANGGIGAASTVQYLANGAAVLSPGNANLLTITNPANTVADIIGRCSGASCTPGFYSIVPTYGASTSQTYLDIGNAQGQYLDASGAVYAASSSGTTPMPAIVNQPLLTTIASCGTATPGAACTSTAFVLATAATASGSFVMTHDDGPAFNAAIAAAAAAAHPVYAPAGSYPIATTLNLNNISGMRLRGESAVGGAATILNWVGGIGGTMLQVFKTRGSLVQNLTLTGASGATPAVGVDIDNAGAGSVAPTHDTLRDMGIALISNPIRLANLGSANCDNMSFDRITIGNGADGGHTAVWIGGAGQTDNERFTNLTISYGPWDQLFDLGGVRGTQVGSVYIGGLETSAGDTIGVHIANTVKRLQLDGWYVEGLARLLYDDSGFGLTTFVSNGYFNAPNVAPDQFYVVAGSGQLASTNTTWGVSGEMLKINVGAPNRFRTYSGRLTSLGDTFSDPRGIFTPYSTSGNYSVLIQGASGLADTGDAGNTQSSFAARIVGPLIAPTIWGGDNSTGRITTAKVGTIAAPTVTSTGANAGQSHSYYLVCHDANGGTTAVSAAGITSASVTTLNLNTSDYNIITWPFYPGCVSFDVYRDATSGASLLASNVSQTVVVNNAPGYQVLDQGQAASTSTAPTVDTTGDSLVSGALSAGSVATIANGNLSINGSGLLSEGITTLASLPATCNAGQEIYCSDCKSVADGVFMASTCAGNGSGSIAVCRSGNSWKCGR
ncbi:MAG TPA: hypothetical protein VMV15_04800 [Candidatus Binataceae bacterium]|nr:hypothetical protein [Candidatus Binataceae bacterium]